MSGFLPWAVPLVLAAVALLCAPLLRRRGDGVPPARALAAGFALGVPALAAALYPLLSNWSWRASAAREAEAARAGVPALLDAVAAHPDDARAFVRLGGAWTGLQRWPEARSAFEDALKLTDWHDPQALAGLGQVLVLSGDGRVSPSALAMFERALAADPRSAQALFYSGLAYLQDGRLAEARARLAALVALDPPANVKGALEKQLAQIDTELADQAASAASAVRLRISLAPALAGRVPLGASLFLFVPAPGGGPPLAAKRLAAGLPQEASISAADAMIPGRTFKAGDRVRVSARLSKSGTPTGSAGDLYGTLEVRAGEGAVRDLIIDAEQR